MDIYRSYRSWGKPIFNPTIMNILNPVKNPYKTPDLYLSFHAFYDSKGNSPIRWSDITAGVYDATIDSWAAELKELAGAHAYVCFHHEMENEEGAYPNGCGTPTDFQAAYWYFRQRIESPLFNGVPNLTWVITFMRNTFAPPLKHGGPDVWWPSGSPYEEIPDDHLVGVDIYNRNMCHFKAGARSARSSTTPTSSRWTRAATSSSANAAAWRATPAAPLASSGPTRRGGSRTPLRDAEQLLVEPRGAVLLGRDGIRGRRVSYRHVAGVAGRVRRARQRLPVHGVTLEALGSPGPAFAPGSGTVDRRPE